MALGSVTVTAQTGPARAITAVTLQNVDTVAINVDDKILQVFQQGAQNVKEFDLSGATTLTCTITGGVYAFVIS